MSMAGLECLDMQVLKPALAPRDTHCMGTSWRGPLPSLTT